MKNIKLYEEFFFKKSVDDKIGLKILNKIKNINADNLLKSNNEYRYIINRGNDNMDIDPLGEENWGDLVEIRSIVNYYYEGDACYNLYISFQDQTNEIDTKYAKKIFKVFDNFYNNIEKNKEIERKKKLMAHL